MADRARGAKESVETSPLVVDERARLDHLVTLVDHCNAAIDLADKLENKFLSYLLSMAVQEARASMRKPR